MSDDFRIEEKDDPRTLTNELVSDAEKEEISFDADVAPFDAELTKLMEYYYQFEKLLSECGEVAYYFKTLQNIRRGSFPVKDVLRKYGHNEEYYKENVEKYVASARSTLADLKNVYKDEALPYSEKDFLNALVNEDRRRSYYETVHLGKKNKKFFSYKDFEARYQRRLKNREKKNNKPH